MGMTDTATSVDDVRQAFASNYAEIQYHFVQFLCDHLADCSRNFGGDLSLMLVLALVGQSRLNASIAAKKGMLKNHPWISASSIADLSGMSRETVRRKLKDLERRGWVRQNDHAGWEILVQGDVSQAKLDLKALDERALDRLARFFWSAIKLMRT
jgi:hypothetical protein